jgi:predicted HTH transcriptional regulator
MALRSIDKGLNASEDQVLRKALDEARATVSSCLGLLGVVAKAKLTPKRRAKAAVALDSEQVLTYARNNAGMKGEVIAEQFGTDTATLRVVLKQLAADGAITSEGKGRGTVYVAAGKRVVVAS